MRKSLAPEELSTSACIPTYLLTNPHVSSAAKHTYLILSSLMDGEPVNLTTHELMHLLPPLEAYVGDLDPWLAITGWLRELEAVGYAQWRPAGTDTFDVLVSMFQREVGE